MEVSTATANATGKKLCVHREMESLQLWMCRLPFFSLGNMWFDITIVLWNKKLIMFGVSIFLLVHVFWNKTMLENVHILWDGAMEGVVYCSLLWWIWSLKSGLVNGKEMPPPKATVDFFFMSYMKSLELARNYSTESEGASTFVPIHFTKLPSCPSI